MRSLTVHGIDEGELRLLLRCLPNDFRRVYICGAKRDEACPHPAGRNLPDIPSYKKGRNDVIPV